MKWWDLYTKKIEYFSSTKFYEHNNEFGKVWSNRYALMNGKNSSALPTLNIDLSDHPSTKYDILEATENFPPRGTHIGIINQYY